MDRGQVIAMLRAHEPEVKAAGVLSLSVFGSVAREDAGPESLGRLCVWRLLDYFGRLDDLEQ